MAAVRTRIVLGLCAAVLLVAGCSGDGGSGATTTTGPGGASTVPGATTVPEATTSASTSTSTAPTTTALVLRPDGLGLGATVIRFGTSKADTLAALEPGLGTSDETGPGCELAGPTANVVRWKELRLQFVGDAFDSYNVRPPAGGPPVLGLTTEAGIGLGSTVAQVQAAYGSRLAIPGLPPEFGGKDFAVSFPGTDRKLLGSLSDTGPTGTVTAVFTQTCE
ncbi:MAG: hypothetical protein QOI99_832 [Actinomycetota bacterium]|nr:hypothetical protein [Actinomycetota bacterium]